jgi:CRP/FNR family transcriptional regulator, anaerobic regulatory protein
MEIEKLLNESGFTVDQIKEISTKLKPQALKKGEYFLKLGEKTKKLGILINGLLYASYTSEDGNEWISRFYYHPDNIILSNHESFYLDKTSTENIVAYEECEILEISKIDLNLLLKKYPDLERLVRSIAEESYINAIRRIHDLQSLTADQRIKKFMKLYPDLFKFYKRKDIASYLGIHRNVFTRVLNKINKE